MKTSPIPESPSAKLDSFLHRLPDQIFVHYNKLDLDEESIPELSKTLLLKNETIKKYMKKGRYPLKLITSLQPFKNEIQASIEKENEGYFSKWKIVRLPSQITPKLAYFVGYLQGDGSIESNRKRINFTDEYKEQLEQINRLTEELFNIKGLLNAVNTTISKKPCYQLSIGSLILNAYLHEVFKINRGVKKNLRIPEEIKKHKELLRWYIVGLFDADGTFPKEPKKCKQLFVDITLKDKEFIMELKEVLKQFGIETLKPYCRRAKSPSSEYISETWELRLRRRGMINRFLKEIGFAHPNKQSRVAKMSL